VAKGHQDLNEIERMIAEFKKESEKLRKEEFDEARRIASLVIPSIKEDLNDNSLEIGVVDGLSRVTGPKSFSLWYIAFLYRDYDTILALSQHETTHLRYEFPECLLKEVMVDRVAAEEFGPYALFSFHIQTALTETPEIATYPLASLVNIKPLLLHKCQRKCVEKALKIHYMELLFELLDVINATTEKEKLYVGRKFGTIITDEIKNEAENLFSELITGLDLEREIIQYCAKNPLLAVEMIDNSQLFIRDYSKLEDALVLKSLTYKKI
jgi:hypothetical protein